MPHNRSLALAAVVILLTLLLLKDQAAAAARHMPWAGPDAVSAAYLTHMAALQFRRVTASVSSVVSFG